MAPEPWLCIGDFNEITSALEKSSSSVRPPMKDSHLADLGFSTPKFTWCNGRNGSAYTRERLDRVVANVSWTLMFDVVEVNVMARSSSDHHPILVNFSYTRDVS